MRIFVLKNGDAATELQRLAKGIEPPHAYISEIFLLRSLGDLNIVGYSAIGKESSFAGVRARTIVRKRTFSSEIKFNLKIWRLLTELQPNIVVVLHAYELLVIPYLWCRINKKPFLPCVAGQPEPENIHLLRKLLIKVIVRPLLRSCPQILARARLIKSALMEWRIPEERISVYLPPYTRDFFDCGHFLPIQQDKFNIVFVGRLVLLKGVYDLIAIIKEVLEKAPSAHLFIVGSGPEQASMERQVAALGIEQSVTFVGEVPQTDVYGYLVPADVALLPSYHEGLGKTALEALLSGLPVLATAGTGLSEFVEHNSNGYLLPKGDIQGFAATLVKLIENPLSLVPLRENALKTREKILSNSNTFSTTVAEFISALGHEQETKVQ